LQLARLIKDAFGNLVAGKDRVYHMVVGSLEIERVTAMTLTICVTKRSALSIFYAAVNYAYPW
jgi:hypothetical protein